MQPTCFSWVSLRTVGAQLINRSFKQCYLQYTHNLNPANPHPPHTLASTLQLLSVSKLQHRWICPSQSCLLQQQQPELEDGCHAAQDEGCVAWDCTLQSCWYFHQCLRQALALHNWHSDPKLAHVLLHGALSAHSPLALLPWMLLYTLHMRGSLAAESRNVGACCGCH